MAVYKRVGTDGRTTHWQAVIDVEDATGKRKRKVVGTFRTKKEAEAEERDAQVKRDRGTLLEASTTTIGELLDEWLKVEAPQGVAAENLPAYEQIIRLHLKPVIGSTRAQKLTTKQIETLLADMRAAGKSASLITKTLQRLNAALKMAKRWGMIHTNPAEGVKATMVPAKPPMVWTPTEIAAFLAKAKADSAHHHLYFLLALETGARTSELLGLAWTDVDWDRGTLQLGRRAIRLLGGTPFIKQTAKTSAGLRTVKLSPATLDAVRQFQTAWNDKREAAEEWSNPDELIFVTASGRPVNPSHVKVSLERLIKLTGVTRITPHELRKTSITLALAGGANPNAVSRRVGHKDVGLTLRVYSAVTTSMEDEVVGILGAALSAPVPSRAAD
ncbi:MAG: site-specific integrase [Chloroflexota bacterium]|nr:site-specific integrase [Chloroflexota bacterium]